MPVAAGETWPRAAFGADQGPWRGSQGTGQTVATKICHSFQRAGWCRWGTKCKFSHDLREPLSPHTLENRVWSERTDATSLDICAYGGRRALRVMSYNMLADELAVKFARDLYRAVPQWCLQWSHRFGLLVSEIRHWHPDLGGLQELDHVDEFEAALQSLGYEGSFAGRGGMHHDGCYSFWDTEQYALVTSQAISFQDHDLRENAALLVLLRPRQPAWPLVLLANTHLLFNPKRGDIKIGQARMVVEAMAAMESKAQSPVAHFLVGDFNSGAGSAVYRFLLTGILDCAAEDRRNLSGQLIQEASISLHAFNQGVPEPPPYRQCLPAHAIGKQPTISVDVQLPLEQGAAAGALSNPCTPRSSLDLLLQPGQQAVIRATSFNEEAQLSRESSAGWRPTTVQHSISFPCMPALAQEGDSPDNPRYLYTDQFGQQTWSHVPPLAQADVPRHLFFHDPMCCEEASPAGPPPRTLFRTPSELERRRNLATWNLEQLQNAVGPSVSPASSQHGAASGHAQQYNSGSAPTHGGAFMRHPSGIPHSNGSSMHNANQAGRLLATLTDAPPAKSQKKHRVQASIQAHASALSPPRSLFLGDPLGDSSVHSRASERDVDVSNHSQVSELSSLSEGGPLTSAELGPQSEPVRIPSRRSIHASVAAHVRAAAAAVAVKAEQDPVVRQALASRRSSEWASTSVGTQQQQRGRGSRELSRRSSWDLAGQVWIARHPLQLCSATHDILGKELPYTSCHGKFIGSVDFVWFSPTAGDYAVVPQRVLLPPPLESLSCGLPSPQWPSDHISLVVDFDIMLIRRD